MTGSGLRAASGIVAAGLALGVAELVSVAVDTSSAPLAAIGATVVDHTPDGVREWAIDTFGTNDKLVLFVSMGVVALGVAAFAGRIERVSRPLGSVLLAVFGLVAVVAAVNRPAASWTWALPTIVGVALGIAVLRLLISYCEPASSGSGRPDPATEESADARMDRRQAVRGIVGVGVLAVATGVAGRVLGSSAHNVSGERAAVQLPVPNTPVPQVDPAADLRIPGLTPYLTPNADFYRIDTALVVPQVSIDTWSLRIHGMVDREIRLSYADLARRTPVERLVTLTCVSNPVGGDLVGNASWLGYRLDELIAAAGPHPDADMVLSRSIDGFTAGSPLAALTDGRDALLAVGMNGEPLPVKHGYPARLVVPGLYGYVSATKWVTELEITRFDRAQAYWTKRGWAARGPIKIGTRIDTPHTGGRLTAGDITVAGVAWAQHRGITTVEVQIDDGPWQTARLAAEPSVDTWRQWTYTWPATPGPHTLRARATDGTGETQTSEPRDVIPDGASGYPDVSVRVA
ncbi:DMSO/TMAO reductase YedYZ molybdopterin-dependent catalytic subunit [Nocardia transvalensis]|uniref:DMSO/TMAO reductase YedYZ molybdopterin-dependent catalytic subunit n=1 Tax=Nocardia transvalensis TaxID=37333 RepID=A0A7W9PB38_9NOCA|nr:molybdopterin-dependent oxidoreductase [Nocardia transvalensis]MBB5912419.1 DMSO/TMAO reductase YedYZ molybdopterin-dependent catalytic subunit [Nocardia transvalensis]